MESRKLYREISAFLALAQHESFTKAAEYLGVSQPTLSRHVARLENKIGAELVLRDTRNVELTELGRIFASDLAKGADRIQLAYQNAQKMIEGKKGTLAIAYNTIPMNTYVLPILLRDFRAYYPDIETSLYCIPSHEQHTALASGNIDIAFCSSPFLESGYDHKIVSKHKLMAVISSSDLLAQKNELRPDDLLGKTLILGESKAWEPFNIQILEFLNSYSIEENPIIRAYDFDSLAALVMSGNGIGFFVEIAKEMRRPSLKVLPIEGFDKEISLYINWKTNSPNPALRLFIEHVLKTTNSHVTEEGVIDEISGL
ncbi:LysR family transcriptional regulator [Grimontia kaedaensis]|uniref:LysR family transcriptional regulator n=1 Tax=Grimontia kaedaensis TaxID=2872157 RepID=A0ABY4X249_9GAMM|nr:LysR family transcriptional regulator [Grimontia kaedaensis]USH05334.1 LysR family transcriptional regulator [Grimontia kaedaensis]